MKHQYRLSIEPLSTPVEAERWPYRAMSTLTVHLASNWRRLNRNLIWLNTQSGGTRIFLSMKPQSAELPLCPKCAKSMMLAQPWQRLCGLPEINTFECKRCSIVFTELDTGEGPVPERVIALHEETYHTLQ